MQKTAKHTTTACSSVFLMLLTVFVIVLIVPAAFAEETSGTNSTTSAVISVKTDVFQPSDQNQSENVSVAADDTLAISQESASADTQGSTKATSSDKEGASSAVQATSQSGSALVTTNAGVSEDITAQSSATPEAVSVTAHVENIGWMSPITNGEAAGTTGQALRVEALRFGIVYSDGSVDTGAISAQAHVENIGWQSMVSNGDVVGTTGQSLRIEALRITLSSALVNQGYNVYYRVHVQNIGWMAWTKNGASAGSAGEALRIEALQVQITKGSPDNSGVGPSATSESFEGPPTLSYTAHVQNIGWQDDVSNGAMAGTTEEGLRVEAFKIDATSPLYSGGIEYSAHVQNIGWQGYMGNGAVAGTVGESLQVEALRIRLTGELASHYDVYYCVHIQNIGWMGWAKNDEQAGSVGKSFRVEAFQVMLVDKGGAAPGSTENHFLDSYIYLDAGHGWGSSEDGVYDSGALGCGYVEAEQTAELVQKIAYYAKTDYGLNVYSNVDTGVNYWNRQADAKARGCSSLVSIHFNSYNGSATGSESFIHANNPNSRSAELQDVMHESLIEGMGITDRGKKTGVLSVCSGANGGLPATLLEICFIDNPYDMGVYKSHEDAVAKQIAWGLKQASDRGF